MRHLALLLALTALPASAQTVVERMTCGVISGTVVDNFGDPLPGANVIVGGTQLGAATNLEGEYRIACVPPGTYDVTASFVGYEPVVATVSMTVQPSTEHSAHYDLVEATMYGDFCFGSYYEPPLISTDPYASRILTGEEIERLPVGR